MFYSFGAMAVWDCAAEDIPLVLDYFASQLTSTSSTRRLSVSSASKKVQWAKYTSPTRRGNGRTIDVRTSDVLTAPSNLCNGKAKYMPPTHDADGNVVQSGNIWWERFFFLELAYHGKELFFVNPNDVATLDLDSLGLDVAYEGSPYAKTDGRLPTLHDLLQRLQYTVSAFNGWAKQNAHKYGGWTHNTATDNLINDFSIVVMKTNPTLATHVTPCP